MEELSEPFYEGGGQTGLKKTKGGSITHFSGWDVFFVCFLWGEIYTQFWGGSQFATVHSWWWVIPGTYFFKTKKKLHFNIIFMKFDIKII